MPDIEYNSKDDHNCKQNTQTNDDIKQISFQYHYDIAESKGNKRRNYEINEFHNIAIKPPKCMKYHANRSIGNNPRRYFNKNFSRY